MSYKNATLLKRYKTALRRAEHRLQLVYRDPQPDLDELEMWRAERAKIRARIRALRTHYHGVIVSEHAILRYLCRVKGLDLDAIATEILPEVTREQILEVGDGLFPVDGFRVRVKDGVVVTVT